MLTSDSIAREIDAQFARPIDVSLTMANDSLLKEYLYAEANRLDDPSYEASLTAYLKAYREKYDYDSVFLASAATTRYYHYNGINRTLETGNTVIVLSVASSLSMLSAYSSSLPRNA